MAKTPARPFQLGKGAALKAAALHLRAFPMDFLPSMGPRFLEALYRGMLASEHSVCYAVADEAKLQGFVLATDDSSALFKDAMARQFPMLSLTALGGILRRPSLAGRAFSTFFYNDPAKPGGGIPAELMVIAVSEDARGKGVGSALVHALDADFEKRGIMEYKVAVYASNEPANRFYTSLGFHPLGEFKLYGKRCKVYSRKSCGGNDGH